MENKSRKLTLCRHWGGTQTRSRVYPTVLIEGKWFLEYGFNAGDQVTITNPSPGSLLITVTKPAAVMAIERERKEYERGLQRLQELEAA